MFSLPASAWLSAVKTAARAVIPKPVVPALENVRFDVRDGWLSLTASDSETTVTVRRELSSCSYEGSFLVPAAYAVSPFAGLALRRIEFRPFDGRLDVSWEGGSVSLPTLPADDWPETFVKEGREESGVVDIPSLKEGLDLVDYACAKDEVRQVLCGVNLEFRGAGLDLVATDAHRLAVASVPKASSPRAFTILLPRRTAAVLKPLLGGDGEVAVRRYDKYATFSLEDKGVFVSGRLLEGTFPNWRSVVPSSRAMSARVYRTDLLDVWKRIDACVGPDGVLRLEFGRTRLELSGRDLGFNVSGQEVVSCSDGPERFVIGLRSKLFQSVIENLPGMRALIEFSDPKMNVVFRDADEDAEKVHVLALLTPMMLTNE